MRVCDYLASFLAEKRIPVAYEVVGGMIVQLLDSIALKGQTKLISMHHEQAAAFAADGFGRATGLPGVAFATSGPGATNLLTGIGSCYFDGTPAIFITGQVNTHEQRGDRAVRQLGFQETDIVSMAQPVTKASFRVINADEVPSVLETAFQLATSGRPGPILVDIPMDIQRRQIVPANAPEVATQPHDAWADGALLERVFAALRAAERPLILAGGGIRSARAAESFRRFADAVHVPVVHSLMGVDLLPAQHPDRVGMIGSYGNRWANHALHEADALLVLGSRLDIRQTGADTAAFRGERPFFHVDVDAAEMNNRVTGVVAIRAELKEFLANRPERPLHDRESAWCRKIAALHARWPDIAELGDRFEINPNTLMHMISAAASNSAGYVVDVGQHQMWAAQSLQLSAGQRFLTSGGMGSMGFALPAAIGWAAAERRMLTVIAGDGGFQCNIQELQTVTRNQLPLKIVILNNRTHGMVRQFQETYFEKRYQSTVDGYSAPNFSHVAKAYGIRSERVTRKSELESALAMLYSDDAPALLEIMIDTNANAYPKLAFGKPITEMEPLAQPVGMEST